MIKKRNRLIYLDGFTLIELIITMILAGIFIIAFYWIFLTANKYWQSYQTNQRKDINLLIFLTTIERDIYLSQQIIFSTPVEFNLISNNDSITYVFEGKIIRISNESTDTFDVRIRNINSISTDFNSHSNLIKQIEFNVEEPTLSKKIILNKYYTSMDLMESYSQ